MQAPTCFGFLQTIIREHPELLKSTARFSTSRKSNKTETHRLEQNWHYTYSVGFRSSKCSLRMVCEKPKHVFT
jgi:hypothetical protein